MEIDGEQYLEVSNAFRVRNEISQVATYATPTNPNPSVLEENAIVPANAIPPPIEAPNGQSEKPVVACPTS